MYKGGKIMFHIRSISAGWIMGQISDGNKIHYFDYSYITNFFDDFMLALLTVSGQWPADEQRHSFRTELEPAKEYWTVSRFQDNLHIHIRTYKNREAKEACKEVLLVCEYHRFLTDFILEVERLLSVFGLIGYRENWTYEFPISLFLKLKDSFNDINTLSYRTLSAEDNVGEKVKVTDFISEIELMKSIKNF